MSPKQSLSDGRLPPFSYITHATMAALRAHFERAQEVKLSTGLALYIGIAWLLSTEEQDGRHEGALEKTREEIGAAGGVSATNVTRYSQHLVAAEVLELERLVAGGANLYRWTLVEPPFHAPHQIGEAVGAHPQDGDTPHQDGEAPNQNGETPLQIGEATNKGKKTDKKKPPVSPPGGDGFEPLIVEVFEFWKELTGRNGRTALSAKRRRAVKQRLEEPGREVDELKLAIANVAASDWHMKRGKFANREGKVQSDLTLICRDAEHLEDYRDMGAQGDSVAVALRASIDQVETEPVEPSERADQAWAQAKANLAASVPESTYRIWLDPFDAVGERRGKLILVDCGSDGKERRRCEWVAKRYKALIVEALDGAFSDVDLLDEMPAELGEA